MDEKQKLIFQAAVQIAQGMLENQSLLGDLVMGTISHEIVANASFKIAKELYNLSINV